MPGCDEINCRNPVETAALMRDLREPWIAFKTMATGVIPPAQGFNYAFNNGADFICAGMFDWQLVGDLNIALDAIRGTASRQRPWRATTVQG